MFARVLKIFGIVALCAIFIFAAVEIWVYRNREKIFRSVQEIVNENLNGNLEIGDFKFRPFYGGLGLNFTLSKVRLTDSLYQKHNKPFLEAELLHVALDLKGFYKGNIRVKNLVLQDGSLNMFTMRDGYSNLTIFQSGNKKKKDKKEGNGDILDKLGNLRFINFSVAFADSVKKKYYGALFHDATNIITLTDTTTNASFAGSVLFKGLTFKPEKGGFLVNQETNIALALAYDSDEKKLNIHPSILESATRDKIGITGDFDFSDTIRNFSMNFTANKIAVKDAVPLLTKRLRNQIDSLGIQAKVDTKVKVIGQLASQNKARVDVEFETDTFNYELPVGVLRNLKAAGKFTNQADTTRVPEIWNSTLIAPKVTGLFEKIPFTFKFSVKNFENPRAVLDGRVDADSTNLGALLDETRYKFKSGTAKIDFHFNGSLKNFYNSAKDRFDGKIIGKASLNNIAMDYVPRKVKLSRINGDFTFNEKAVVFKDLHFHDGHNMLYLRGQLLDLIPYLFGSPKPLRANVDINIPKWKVTWLESLFAARTNVSTKKRQKLKLADLLDNAIDKMEVVAKLDAKELQYRLFTARDVKGQFTIKENAVSIEYFVMKAFGRGNFRVSGVMDNSGKGQPRLAVSGRVSNADVHSVFSSFDNFGQKTITSDNLKGILNTDFKFEANLNNNVRLIPSSMKGDLHFDLTNGYIIDFEPFMKMKKLIFKKRNFERVKFAPIRNDIRLRGQEIEIAPMEIESNVLTLYLDGIYSFGNKTDINIQIPLSNLKKRDSTYVLDPNNEEKKGGSKIFLRAIDENGEVNIKLAFRRKRDKNKQKDEEPEIDPATIEK
ncbi:AsmA-like C-terminal region-containing protein [Dyadobacter sp. CY343]|uniref:AsmA-like C-terminal region-containing protein n=1 Tax=Dyadobacter sp. CY343 TaxID=2907299 RepID=UPI001F3F0204|nr:AsmA-like C-terminal region-containing protein [Dyadobacter sp. CY343]MCE7062574.1 AsmA-like C-terminal region-containing protein [Dyadobacter sp. CY343]